MGTVHRQRPAPDGTWDYASAPAVAYTAGATRRVLVGKAEGERDFAVRYFTIPAGGASRLESHAHPHGVVVTHGGGRVLLGESWHDLGVGDAVYVEPHERHQFVAGPSAPLGFVCVIPNLERHP